MNAPIGGKHYFDKRDFYLVRFFGNFSADLAIWSFYFTQVANLSQGLAVSIHALIFIVVACSDMPMGFISDRFGRKISAISGYVLRISGALLTLVFPSYYCLILASILTGIGWSLLSGTMEAYLYDNLKYKQRQSEFNQVLVNGVSFEYLARCLAFSSAGFLFNYAPQLPYVLMCFSIVLALVVLIKSYEYPYFEGGEIKSKSAILIPAIRQLVKSQSLLGLILFVVCLEAFAEQLWLLFQPIMKQVGFFISSIGLIYAGAALASFLGSQMFKLFLGQSLLRKLIFFIFLVLLSLVLIITASKLGVLMGIFIVSIAYGFISPITSIIVNNYTKSDYRVTMLSLVSTFKSLSIGILGVIVGGITRQYSISISLYLLWVIFIIFLFYVYFAKKLKKELTTD